MLAKCGELPKTSQPSPARFEETYRRLAADGSEIVSIHLSARLSGTVRAAEIARDTLRGKAHVEVIDVSSGEPRSGLIVMAAARLAKQGAEVREIASLVRRLSPNVHLLFFVDTLEYLQRRRADWAGERPARRLAKHPPDFELEDGEIHPVEKVRTRSKAINRLVEFVELFPHVDEIAVVYSNESMDLENLLRRIDPIFSPTADRPRQVRPGGRHARRAKRTGRVCVPGCDWLR